MKRQFHYRMFMFRGVPGNDNLELTVANMKYVIYVNDVFICKYIFKKMREKFCKVYVLQISINNIAVATHFVHRVTKMCLYTFW